MDQDLAGKIVFLTGGTEGIGKVGALELARRGARLTIAGRDREKTERVVAELKAGSGNDGIDFVLGDLSLISGVRAVAAELKSRRDRLDVLVNNAGAVFQKYRLTAEGFETTFALNHLSYFLLARELVDLLAKAPGARVVSTSSGAHSRGRIDLDTIARRPSGSAGFSAYCDSKLCNILFTRELARRVADRGIVANCFHPGFVRSGFGLNNPGLFGGAIKVAGALFARTPEKGAETLVWLAASPDAAKPSGEYFHDMKVAATSRRAKDDATAKALWEMSERIVGASA
jgi:NAD(P)-dependent dehydrogenase (short-subunit alcohol dehydrogenase family)